MTCTTLFLHKLAIERCQYNLAQLSTVLYTESALEKTTPSGQTVQALIEILNRDLVILNDFVDQYRGEVVDEAANDL